MQGISVYTRPGRPTFYVAYDCPLRAQRVCESSGILVTDHRGRLAAYAYAREKSASGVMHGQGRDISAWGNWVEAWLRMRYSAQLLTLTNYLACWKHVHQFLREHKIPTPRALHYQLVVDFVLWRESQRKRNTQRKISRNTALKEVKVLSRIMREAVRRGYATNNPCFRISEDVRKAPAPLKPEFTDEQVALVRAELAKHWHDAFDWMPIAFEIALLQTCRLRATQIPMERIDLEAGTIEFHEKGGKEFTVPIHPDLRPLLVRLKEEGRKVTCTIPWLASRTFTDVMKRLGLPHTFHCTRVTGITRMARAGVPEQQAMAYVCHGGWAVHRIYQRLKPADVQGCHSALDFAAPVPASGSPQTGDASPARPRPSRELSKGRQRSVPPTPGLRATG